MHGTSLVIRLNNNVLRNNCTSLRGVAEKAKTEDLRRRKLQDLERYVENYPVYPRFCNMHVDLIA